MGLKKGWMGFSFHSGQSQRLNSDPKPRCLTYRKCHDGECWKLTGGCYHCGDKGHHVRECPKRSYVRRTIPEPTTQEPKKSGKDQEKTIPTGQRPPL